MKKLLLLAILIFPFSVSAQNVSEVWNYNVKPGTEAWNDLRTEMERVNAMQIPVEILNKMTSEEFVTTCINFPLFGYYSAFNTPKEGFTIMFSRFNIFSKLCEYDNIGNYLIKIYEDAGMNGWEKYEDKLENEFWTLKLNYLEYLISQEEIINRLDHNEQMELLKIAETKLDQKRSDASFNSIPGISPTVLIITMILQFQKAIPESLTEKKEFQYFMKTGLLDNSGIINEILTSVNR